MPIAGAKRANVGWLFDQSKYCTVFTTSAVSVYDCSANFLLGFDLVFNVIIPNRHEVLILSQSHGRVSTANANFDVV